MVVERRMRGETRIEDGDGALYLVGGSQARGGRRPSRTARPQTARERAAHEQAVRDAAQELHQAIYWAAAQGFSVRWTPEGELTRTARALRTDGTPVPMGYPIVMASSLGTTRCGYLLLSRGVFRVAAGDNLNPIHMATAAIHRAVLALEEVSTLTSITQVVVFCHHGASHQQRVWIPSASRSASRSASQERGA